MRLRVAMRDQFTRLAITHFPRQISRNYINGDNDGGNARDSARDRAQCRRAWRCGKVG